MATPVTLPGTYSLIMEYANNANPEDTWRNVFDFNYPTVPAIGSDLPFALASLATSCIRSDCSLIKRSLYNWAKGRQPYPLGEPLQVDTTVIAGAAAVPWTALDATYEPAGGEIALRADHEPFVGGKPGRTFFRGLLGKLDIQAVTGGNWALVPSLSSLQTNFNAILAGTTLNSYLGEPPSGKFLVVVRYSPKTNIVHGFSPLNTINLIGVTTCRRTHKNKK